MRNRCKISLTLFSILIIVIMISKFPSGLGQMREPPRPPFGWDFKPEDFELLRRLLPMYFTFKSIIQTINSILILSIVLIHIGIYRKTGTKFSLGLVIFSTAILLYTIMSNPIVHNLLGFRRIGFGPLLLIPDILTLIASAVLIYLSRQ